MKPAPFDLIRATGTVAATNVFVRLDGEWRLAVHHASPVMGRA